MLNMELNIQCYVLFLIACGYVLIIFLLAGVKNENMGCGKCCSFSFPPERVVLQ